MIPLFIGAAVVGILLLHNRADRMVDDPHVQEGGAPPADSVSKKPEPETAGEGLPQLTLIDNDPPPQQPGLSPFTPGAAPAPDESGGVPAVRTAHISTAPNGRGLTERELDRRVAANLRNRGMTGSGFII